MFVSEPQQTNVEVGQFAPVHDTPQCYVYNVAAAQIPPAATLQIYPGNPKKECFYRIDPGSQLHVYVRNADNVCEAKGHVSLNDEYVYFKTKSDSISIYVIVCRDKLEADALIKTVCT